MAAQVLVSRIAAHLLNNEIVALPTESIYGLSCLVRKNALQKLTQLKKRASGKAYILVSDELRRLADYVDLARLNEKQLASLSAPGCTPITWIVPAKTHYSLLMGSQTSLAVRITSHPLLRQLVAMLGEPIVSTSVNLSGLPPAKTYAEILAYFPTELAYIHPECEGVGTPSKIYDLRTGRCLR